MSVIKIDLQKPVQEFEIDGKVYEVGYDDESLRAYEKQSKVFYEKAKTNVDLTKLSDEEKKELETKQYQLLKETIEVFFGQGSYEEIYTATGKSLINMTKVITALFEWLQSKLGAINEQAKAYYTR